MQLDSPRSHARHGEKLFPCRMSPRVERSNLKISSVALVNEAPLMLVIGQSLAARVVSPRESIKFMY